MPSPVGNVRERATPVQLVATGAGAMQLATTVIINGHNGTTLHYCYGKTHQLASLDAVVSAARFQAVVLKSLMHPRCDMRQIFKWQLCGVCEIHNVPMPAIFASGTKAVLRRQS
jgi:hypothetical protein